MVAVAMCQPDGFTCAIAQVIQLRSSRLSAPDGRYVQNVRRMKREDSLDPFLPHHPAYGEGLADSAALACYHRAVKCLRANLVALLDSALHIDNIAYLEVRNLVLQTLIRNGIKYLSLHEYISCVR